MGEKEEQRKKKTISLGEGLEEYLGSFKIGTAGGSSTGSASAKKKTMNLLTCWQRVAPKRLLDHTDNVVYSTRSKKTELLIYVDNATYAAELSMDKELYRHMMQQELGKEIENINFLVSRKSSFRKRTSN